MDSFSGLDTTKQEPDLSHLSPLERTVNLIFTLVPLGNMGIVTFLLTKRPLIKLTASGSLPFSPPKFMDCFLNICWFNASCPSAEKQKIVHIKVKNINLCFLI